MNASGTLKQQRLKFPNYSPHILLLKSNDTINGESKELTDTELQLVNNKCMKEMHNRAKEDSFFNAVARKRAADQKHHTAKNFRGPSPSEANLLLQGVMQLKVSLSHHAPCLIPTTAPPDNLLAQILNNSITSWSTKYTSNTNSTK